MKFIYLWNFMLKPCIILKWCSGQNSSMKMNKGQDLEKIKTVSYGSWALYFSLMRLIDLWSFMLMPCIVSEICSRQKGTDGQTDGWIGQSLYSTLQGQKKIIVSKWDYFGHQFCVSGESMFTFQEEWNTYDGRECIWDLHNKFTQFQ